MKYFLSVSILVFTLFQISCIDQVNPCDNDGDGLLSRDCGGEDCNDADKTITVNDMDGDGVDSFNCGGTDCDDLDATRFPGGSEFNDAAGNDEDCIPTTCGGSEIDQDGDGFGLPCFNRVDGVDYYNPLGDCDDRNAAIFPGSQICGLKGKILICQGDGTYLEVTCGTCKIQPNGTGICLD